MNNITPCKFCHESDYKEKMHKDIYTEEYYHVDCRPVLKCDQVEKEE